VGEKHTGKTTVANYIKSRVPGTKEIILAEPLKIACKEVFYLSDDQLYDQDKKEQIDSRWGIAPRKMFQRIGDLFRVHLVDVLSELNCGENIFVINAKMRIMAEEKNNTPLIVVSDCRYENEHIILKELPLSHSVRLIRETGNKDEHKSEQITFNTDSIILNNQSMEQLYKQIDELLDRIKIK